MTSWHCADSISQKARLQRVLKLDKWFKVLASEIEYHLAHGSGVVTASTEAMYAMIRSKMRQPHYYAMVKLLEFESTTRTPEEIAVDAYELFGEGRNWYVHNFYAARSRSL